MGDAGAVNHNTSVMVDNTKFLHKESCVDDPNCANLAQLLVPDVIISVSSLKCLMDNHQPSLAKTWDIPFVVRTFKSDVDSRTVVIFGKPLVAREVTDEDCALLACKVAVKVALFKRAWEVKIDQPDEEMKAISPVEDLFGDSNVDIDDLEVFGTENKVWDETLNVVEGETLVQVDGGVDSESEDENLVINDDMEDVSPIRRSSRLQKKDQSPTQEAKNPGISNSLDQMNKEEELDYEPDDDNNDNGKSSDTSSDSEVEDKETAKALFMAKLNAGHAAKKIELTESSEGLINLNNSNKEGSSASSSESDDDCGQLLLQKKMLMLNAISTSPKTRTQDQEQEEGRSSASEKEKVNEENSSSSEEDDDGQLLMQKKMMMMKQAIESPKVSTPPQMNVSVVPPASSPEQTKLASEDQKTEPPPEMEVDTEEVTSPKKKPKVISSSSDSEDDEELDDPVGVKLTELGRENVDRMKLKRKMEIESKLKGMKALHEEKLKNQNIKRSSRIQQRKEKKELQDESAGDKTEGEQEQVTPRRSRRKTQTEVKRKEEMLSNEVPLKSKEESSLKKMSESVPRKKTKQELFSDSDSDEEGRFSKFSKSDNQSKGNLLDTLLTGQNKLLTCDQRKLPHPAPSQPAPSVCQTVTEVAQGLPPIDKFKPPLDGCNVSYRMWKLQNKSPGTRGRTFRCIVRSKVAGMTKEGTVVTPSVKLEHQPSFGAETVTASQASREWIATLVRPNSILARVRVTPDKTIAMVEEKTLPQLTQESRNVGSDPSKQLSNIYNIFSELTQLGAGQYILRHSGKTGAFCDVLEAKETDGTASAGWTATKAGHIDLHKLYTTLQPGDTVPGRVAFSPIDVSVLTPWHRVNGRVPATFEPAGSRKSGGGRGRGRGRGRGGRGRGRGKGQQQKSTE